MGDKQNLLSEFTNSEENLVDVIGHFDVFDNGAEQALCFISFIFEESRFYLVVQEDDSFELHDKGWQSASDYVQASLMNKPPWSFAIGKPLLWSWVLCNHQGYFDGVQLEFSANVESESVVIQLVALGSEIKFRNTSGTCCEITWT